MTNHCDLIINEVAAQHVMYLNNKLYGSQTLVAYGKAKSFTRPLLGEPKLIPSNLIESLVTFSVKRILTQTLQSHRSIDILLTPGNLVDVFVKLDRDKGGKCLSPWTILSIDWDSETLSVPSSGGRLANAAIEEIHPVLCDDCFGGAVRAVNDVHNDEIKDKLSSFDNDGNIPSDVATSKLPITFHLITVLMKLRVSPLLETEMMFLDYG